MTKVELEALLEIEKIDDEVARTTIRNWFIHDANFRTGYLNCGAMMRNAADCEKERQRRQEAEAQRGGGRPGRLPPAAGSGEGETKSA